MLSFLIEKFLVMGLLKFMVSIIFNVIRNCKTVFPKWGLPLVTSPPAT